MLPLDFTIINTSYNIEVIRVLLLYGIYILSLIMKYLIVVSYNVSYKFALFY